MAHTSLIATLLDPPSPDGTDLAALPDSVEWLEVRAVVWEISILAGCAVTSEDGYFILSLLRMMVVGKVVWKTRRVFMIA